MTEFPEDQDLYVGHLSSDERWLFHEMNERALALWEKDGIQRDVVDCLPILAELIQANYPKWGWERKLETTRKLLDFLNEALVLRDFVPEQRQ